MRRIGALSLALALLTACAGKVDAFTVQRVVPRALAGGDLEMVCATGEGSTYTLAGVTKADNPPNRAMIIGNATGAMCAELRAWEDDLASLRAEHLYEGEAQIAAIKDARHAAERHHAVAAERFWTAFAHTEAHYGPVGDDCPSFSKKRDELTYLIGLVAGSSALIHDKAAGSPVGVPLDVLPRVARAAGCLDDAAGWHAPSALQAAAWATVPGSGPEGVDPWALLAESAAAGDTTGVRIGRALQVQIAANAGRAEVTREGIELHATALKSAEADPRWVLLDEYARRISLHQSDLIWTRERGYRTPTLGEFPEAPGATGPEDPFGADPFGGDPFGGPAAEDPADDAPSGDDDTPTDETETPPAAPEETP